MYNQIEKNEIENLNRYKERLSNFNNDFDLKPADNNSHLFYSNNICEWTFDKFKLKSYIKYKSEKYDKWFIIDGEDYQRPTKLLHLFKILGLTIEHLYTLNKNSNSLNEFLHELLYTRYNNVHSQLNEFPTESFKKKLNLGYSKLIDMGKSNISKL